jgi:hypothetical protein
MTDYSYLGRWNFLLNRPIADEGWIDDVEAQRRYESGSGLFAAVDARARNGAAPKFVIEVSPSKVDPGFRAIFLNDAASIVEVITYKTVDGRLFKWISVNYEYPDETTKYELDESTIIVKGKTSPSGDGLLTVNDKSKPTVEKISFRDVPTDDLWLPVPKFGEWANLTKRRSGSVHRPSPNQS